MASHLADDEIGDHGVMEEVREKRPTSLVAKHPHTAVLERIAAMVPTRDEWDSAAGFMEAVASILDGAGIERPAHYGPDGGPR